MLGADPVFTLARSQSTVNTGRSTIIIGQASGNVACLAGDPVMEAGASGAVASAGLVKIGLESRGVVIAMVALHGGTATVAGTLVAN